MKKNIRNLIDLKRIDTLLEGFNKSTGFVTAILDLDGNVLSKSGWRPICTEFHRINSETSKRCTISDTVLANKMEKGEKYHAYKCLNGLMDVAVPLKVKGQHVANLFSGQFFFEKPDIAFFRKQAKEFGFDEKKYLDALSKVPVVSEEKVKTAMDFLLNMTEFISDLAIQKLEQEKITRNLKNNEQKFKSVFESANAGKSITLPSGEINVNEAFCKMLGFSRTELQNKKWQDITPEEDIAPIQKTLDSLMEGKKDSARFEKRYICKNGSHIWADVSVSILRDEYGQPVHFITTLVDITDRKLTDQALRESEEKFFTLFEKSPFAITLSKLPDGRLVAVNEAFEKEFEFTKHEASGKNSKDLGINPDAEVRNLILKKLKASNSVRNQEMVLLSKSGVKHYYETNIDKVVINGEEYLLNTTQNISEYKRAQKKLKESYDLIRIAGEKAKLGGWIVILKENRSYWSDEVAAIHEMPAGYAPQVEDAINFYTPEWRDKITDVFRKCVQKGIPYDEEMEIITATGRRVWVRTIGEAMRDENGNIFKVQGAFQDITLKKQAEKELKNSEARYKAIFESTGTATLIVDEDTTILLANNECLEMFGYDPAQLYGQKWTRFVAPESVQEMLENHQLRRENPKLAPPKYEVKILNCKGEKRNTVLNINMIPGTKQSVVSMLDITEHKQAEEELRKSKSSLEEYFENDISADYVVSVSGEIFSCNKTFLNLFGFEKKTDTEGFDITKLFRNPNDRKQMIRLVKKQGKVENYELELISNEGKTIYALINAIGIFGKDDKLEKIRGYVVEITEQKRFEHTRKLLLEISQLTTKYFTLNSFLAVVHQKLKQIVRADNFYVALYNEKDNTYSFPYHFDEYDEVELNKPYDFSNGFTDHVLKSNQSLIITPEYQLETEKDGTIKGYGDELSVWLGVPFKTKEGSKPNGIIAIQDYKNTETYSETDKTIMEIIAQSIGSFIDRINYQEKLVQAKEKAEESSRLKTAFLNNISHEIRTPMNAILGFSRLLKKSDLDHDKKLSYIETINNSGDHLLSIITDIIDISIIEAGQGKISETRVNVNDILDKISKQNEIRSENIEIKFLSVLTPEQAEIYTDETKLIQIINNLVGNAIKFTQQGHVQCDCKLEKGFVRFDISDTGIGIPKEKLKKIFERFIQTENTIKNALGGMGLGLAIAKSYVDLLGGQIWVTSKPNKGSVFSFTIPFKPVTEKIFIENKYDKINETKLTQSTILIVEDEYNNFLLIKEMLSEFPLNIRHAENGQKAVDMVLNNNDLDLVLMDIKMPIMDGFEALKKIKAVKPQLKIIAQTAYAMQGDKNKIKSSDFDDYIEKPIDQLKLIELLKNNIEI